MEKLLLQGIGDFRMGKYFRRRDSKLSCGRMQQQHARHLRMIGLHKIDARLSRLAAQQRVTRRVEPLWRQGHRCPVTGALATHVKLRTWR